VYGSRILGSKNGSNFISQFRFFANKLLTFLNNLLNNQNLTDAHTCYKALDTELFKNLNLKSADYHINHNIPITGLTPKDIITIVNWYSDFYNVKASLPKSSHYDYVISLIESEELFKNVDQSLKLDDCISICLDSINSPSSEYQLNNVIGNVWEFSLPENNVNYYLDKNKGYKINHNNGNLLYDRNVYKNLSKELVHLKGGSYTSTNYGIIKGSTLIVSDDIYDKDFGFRIVLN
jgi:hypothetical protein